MTGYYLIIVILLFILAISDLIVGVSNDAVNFLNSSIGSRVASRQVIMIVASLGIFVGATFSSGMMEVARKGIFNPDYFFFGEIMVIFLAVMLTDIILLDFFNTIGLPTSTTVSIVFELLGAAVVMSLIKISVSGQGIGALSAYINSSQALLIISGIFLSVAFAFAVGIMVQFISRLLFTFRYHTRHIWLESVWTGLAMTAMTYFLVLKGIKGASFASTDLIEWVQDHIIILLGVAFATWTVIMLILSWRKINVFRIVVLYGTFALAMAFAGNDLVNFIGVPIAGLESFLAWNTSTQDPFNYSMEVLKQPVRTQSYLLVLAGLIMIITLWFSKKARSVTETEVSLGRQSEGHERFSPNYLARGIVASTLKANNFLDQVIPEQLIKRANGSFVSVHSEAKDKPAFDLVRAGVNLTTASILIAFATSLKLPLSTTYVSFMVAMGTSLADKAWGRDSAVYRVAGVLNVIGGWFATALIAFTVSGFFALLIYQFHWVAVVILIVAAGFFIYRSFAYHRKNDAKKQQRVAFERRDEHIDLEALLSQITTRIVEHLRLFKETFCYSIEGLTTDNTEVLRKAAIGVKQLQERNEDFQYELYQSVKRIQESDAEGSRMLIYVFDLEQDMLQSNELIVKACQAHVNNRLNPLKDDQIVDMRYLQDEIASYLDQIMSYIQQKGAGSSLLLKEQKSSLLEKLEDMLSTQVHGIKSERFGARNSQLMFKVLLESKDLVAIAARFIKLYDRIYLSESGATYFSFGSQKEVN